MYQVQVGRVKTIRSKIKANIKRAEEKYCVDVIDSNKKKRGELWRNLKNPEPNNFDNEIVFDGILEKKDSDYC